MDEGEELAELPKLRFLLLLQESFRYQEATGSLLFPNVCRQFVQSSV
jgi:hypothetical protein